MASTREKAIELFQPDEDGYSDWVDIEHFEEAGLRWTANGNLRRGIAWGISDITWEVERGAGRKVVALRMAGWNKNTAFDQTIIPAVRQSLNTQTLCNLSLLPIPRPDREIDHRFGYKNHPDYIEKYKPDNQSTQDFQLIHRALNLQKRQMCVVCVETQTRPAHPTLGFIEGDETIRDRFPCSGCYLAEPERYRGLTD